MTTELMCGGCRDAVTCEADDLVGSDGEVTCPESSRPHGPAVPDPACLVHPDGHCYREDNCERHAGHTGAGCCCCGWLAAAHTGCDC